MTRLREYVCAMTRLVERAANDEPLLLAQGQGLLRDLIAYDDWLPEAFAQPNPEHYEQYLLYCDPFERFSVISFVWLPGQSTGVHDHCVWGLVGVLRGAEMATPYSRCRTGPGLVAGTPLTQQAGEVSALSPRIGDIHTVASAIPDRCSVSIHTYGANMAKISRHAFDPQTGGKKSICSRYANDVLPNLYRAEPAAV